MGLNHIVNGSPVEVKHIALNSTSVNYIVKDDKLVFADSGLYLSGPNTYTVVGSPTIVDGVASGFSGSNYLKLPYFGSTIITDFEMNTECRLSATTASQQQQILFGSYNSTYALDEYRVMIWDNGGASGSVYVRLVDYTDPNNITLKYTTILTGIAWGSYVKINLSCVNSQATVIVKDENDTVLANMAISHPVVLLPMSSGENPSIGAYRSSYSWKGSIDLKNTYIKVNGSLWFYGKNYASANIAPVPSGYTYGTTTTSAIGWVDMRTQAFTAAPEGATYGGQGNKEISSIWYSSLLSGNYLYLNNSIDFNSADTWEINTQIIPTIDKDGRICGQYDVKTGGYNGKQPIIGVVKRKFYLWLSSDGKGNDIANLGPSSFTMTMCKAYDVSLVFTGTQYLLKCKEASASTWGEPIFTVNSSTHVYSDNSLLDLCNQGHDGHIQPLGAALNMTATNIKLDGVTVFNGATAKEDVDYTKVGCVKSITPGNRVYTTTDNGQFLRIEKFIDFNSADTWEMDFHILARDNEDCRIVSGALYDYTTPVLRVFANNGFTFYVTSSGSNWDLTPSGRSGGDYGAPRDYHIRFYFTGSAYKVDYIENNSGDWIQAATLNTSTHQYANSTRSKLSLLSSGWSSGSESKPFKGLFFLDDCKIKLNGNIVFDGATAVEGVDFTNVGCTASFQ